MTVRKEIKTLPERTAYEQYRLHIGCPTCGGSKILGAGTAMERECSQYGNGGKVIIEPRMDQEASQGCRIASYKELSTEESAIRNRKYLARKKERAG